VVEDILELFVKSLKSLYKTIVNVGTKVQRSSKISKAKMLRAKRLKSC